MLFRTLTYAGSAILGVTWSVHSGLEDCSVVSKELFRSNLRFGKLVFWRMTEVQARFCFFKRRLEVTQCVYRKALLCLSADSLVLSISYVKI